MSNNYDLNDYLWEHTEEKEGKVKYGFGKKNSDKGSIDCSGWVCELVAGTFDACDNPLFDDAFDKSPTDNKGSTHFFKSNKYSSPSNVRECVQNQWTSGNLLYNIAAFNAQYDAGGSTPSEKQIENQLIKKNDILANDGALLKPGMIIAMDTGKKDWDANHYKGVDHIVMVVADPKTGDLYISESAGGSGVKKTPLKEWLKTNKVQNSVGLYAIDPFKVPEKKAEQNEMIAFNRGNPASSDYNNPMGNEQILYANNDQTNKNPVEDKSNQAPVTEVDPKGAVLASNKNSPNEQNISYKPSENLLMANNTQQSNQHKPKDNPSTRRTRLRNIMNNDSIPKSEAKDLAINIIFGNRNNNSNQA